MPKHCMTPLSDMASRASLTNALALSLLERLSASLTTLRSVSSKMQFSEALTKPSARKVLADRVRKGELNANPVCRCGEEVVFPRELQTHSTTLHSRTRLEYLPCFPVVLSVDQPKRAPLSLQLPLFTKVSTGVHSFISGSVCHGHLQH